MMKFSPLKLRLFMLFNLPLALIAGLRLHYLDEHSSQIAIRYGFLTQNPFKSIYFAVLCMAGELASGILCLAQIKQTQTPVSMLVTRMETVFTKKATGKVVFTCKDGVLIQETIQKAIETKEGISIETKSIGTNEKGEIVAEMAIQWSFKVKA